MNIIKYWQPYLFISLYCISMVSNGSIDYMELSLDELGDMPITTIASGTPKYAYKSAAVITVITAEQIKAMGATELHEILETVPGVHASIKGGVTYDYRYTIRGIQNGTNSEVLMLMDGTRMSIPTVGSTITGLELPINSIQQVEVIRGPGSAVYGANAFAGVINIVTKKHKDINGTVIGGRVGDHGNESGWSQYSKSYKGWELAASFQYQHSNGDNGRILTTDAQSSLDKKLGTRASLAPGPMNTNYDIYDTHINVNHKYIDMKFWAFNSVTGTRAGTYTALDPDGSFTDGQYLGDLRLSTEDLFTDLELQTHFSYMSSSLKTKFSAYPSGALIPTGADGNISSHPLGLVYFPNGSNERLDQLLNIPALELTGIYKGFNNHIIRISGDLRHETLDTQEFRNFGPGVINKKDLSFSKPITKYNNLINVSNTQYTALPNTSRTIWSAVFQDEWQIYDHLYLTTGFRYDDYSDFGNTVNPRVGLVWDVNHKFNTKLLYGSAFRAPSFTELYNRNGPAPLGNKALKPETIDTVEWVVDYRPYSAVHTSANIYYYKIHDLIQSNTTQGSLNNTFVNSGNQQGIGSEFEWNWQPLHELTITGNYSWQHAMYDETNTILIGSPEHHLYTALRYNFLKDWQIQPQLNWVGGRPTSAQDINSALKDYTTMDITLRGNMLFNKVNFAASLRNVFDTKYYEMVTTTSTGNNLPMQGRSFYFEVSVKF